MAKNKHMVPVGASEVIPIADEGLIPPPEAKEIPLRKAFSLERATSGWVFLTIFRDDMDNIVRIERSEPDLKILAIEKFKIASQRMFNELG